MEKNLKKICITESLCYAPETITQYYESAILQLKFFKREGEINVFPTCSYERVLTFYNSGD